MVVDRLREEDFNGVTIRLWVILEMGVNKILKEPVKMLRWCHSTLRFS